MPASHNRHIRVSKIQWTIGSAAGKLGNSGKCSSKWSKNISMELPTVTNQSVTMVDENGIPYHLSHYKIYLQDAKIVLLSPVNSVDFTCATWFIAL